MEQYAFSWRREYASKNEQGRQDDDHEGSAQTAASAIQGLPEIAAVQGLSKRLMQDWCIVWNYFEEGCHVPQSSVATKVLSNCMPRQPARLTPTGKEGDGDGEHDDNGRRSTHIMEKKRKRDEGSRRVGQRGDGRWWCRLLPPFIGKVGPAAASV
eukprot:5765956-Pleurochrysis_carterae.AAC.1